MQLIDELMNFFGIGSLPETATFMDFLPWFCKLILAVFLMAFIFKCLFTATWKIRKELR